MCVLHITVMRLVPLCRNKAEGARRYIGGHQVPCGSKYWTDARYASHAYECSRRPGITSKCRRFPGTMCRRGSQPHRAGAVAAAPCHERFRGAEGVLIQRETADDLEQIVRGFHQYGSVP